MKKSRKNKFAIIVKQNTCKQVRLLIHIFLYSYIFVVAQLVERRTGIPKVRVQIPLGSTLFPLVSQYRFIMFTCCAEDDSNQVEILYYPHR